jgi:hypothetical protein
MLRNLPRERGVTWKQTTRAVLKLGGNFFETLWVYKTQMFLINYLSSKS